MRRARVHGHPGQSMKSAFAARGLLALMRPHVKAPHARSRPCRGSRARLRRVTATSGSRGEFRNARDSSLVRPIQKAAAGAKVTA